MLQCDGVTSCLIKKNFSKPQCRQQGAASLVLQDLETLALLLLLTCEKMYINVQIVMRHYVCKDDVQSLEISNMIQIILCKFALSCTFHEIYVS